MWILSLLFWSGIILTMNVINFKVLLYNPCINMKMVPLVLLLQILSLPRYCFKDMSVDIGKMKTFLDAAEMWKTSRASWTERKMNSETLWEVKEKRNLPTWLVHMFGKSSILFSHHFFSLPLIFRFHSAHSFQDICSSYVLHILTTKVYFSQFW